MKKPITKEIIIKQLNRNNMVFEYLTNKIAKIEKIIRDNKEIKKNNDWSVNKVNNLKRDRINLGPPPSYSQSFNFYKAKDEIIIATKKIKELERIIEKNIKEKEELEQELEKFG